MRFRAAKQGTSDPQIRKTFLFPPGALLKDSLVKHIPEIK